MVVGIDIALVVGENGVDVRIAPAVRVVRLFIGNGRDGAQQRAVRVKLDKLGDGIALRAVVRVAARLPEEPERAVRTGGHGLDAGAAVEGLHAAVRIHGHAIRHVRVFHDRLGHIIVELHALAGVKVKAENDLGIRVIGIFLTVFVGIGFCAAVRDAGGKVERVAGNAARADPLNILRQIKILRLIRELRRGLVLGIALFCLLRIVRRLRLIFAAPGKNAEQQNERKADAKQTFCHKRDSFLVPIWFAPCCHMVTEIYPKRNPFGTDLRKN